MAFKFGQRMHGYSGNPIVGLTSGGEEIKLSGEELVSMNVWAFPSGIFKLLETSFVEFLSALSDPAKEEFYLPFGLINGLREGLHKSAFKRRNVNGWA